MNKVSLLHSGVIEMCLKIKLVLLLASETCKEVTNMLCLMCGMVTCCVYLVWLCCIPVKQVAEMFAHRTAGRTVQLKKMVANCQHKLHKMHFASNQTLETYPEWRVPSSRARDHLSDKRRGTHCGTGFS